MSFPANSIEGKSLPFLERIENLLADLDSERGKYMAACKSLREDIKEIYTEAREAGVPIKALRQTVRYRELERKQAALGDDLDIDERSTFEQLRDALGDLGDTPLGQAALDLAGGGDEDEDEDVRPRFKKTEDQPPAKKRKPKSPAAEHAQALSGAEADALADIEVKGVIGAAGEALSDPLGVH